MEETPITPKKSFKVELLSDKNNSYSVIFNLNNNSIEITANQTNDIIHKSFSNKYSFEEIRKNKYFLQFDTLEEILDELKERINNNKIIIKENEDNLIINIPLPSSKNKEIIFELKRIMKGNNDRVNELTDLIMKFNKEINNIKNETKQLKDKCNNMENNEIQLKNEIIQLKHENVQLNKDIDEIKVKETQLINENSQLKKDVIELREKLNILFKTFKENQKIHNFDSKIINGNYEYNAILKKWIDPSRAIKAELLYRLSENGEKYSTFHELCDNKGPTLTLFHVNDGNIVGIYTPLSWDSSGTWKKDMDTFIFNLNKNQKYKKLKNISSICCDSSYGPHTADFGCTINIPVKSIKHCADDINQYYDKGSEILPSNNQKKVYNLIEIEVYKIILE